MVRSLNIKATDKLVTNEVFKIIFDQKRLQKLKNKQNRLTKKRDNAIKDIAKVETAKLLGKQDERIATEILKNMNAFLHETEAKIEQCKIRLDELQNERNILETTRRLGFKAEKGMVGISKEKTKSYLETFIDKIDVSYDKENNEHELIVRFKLPLVNDNKELTLNLKKNR